MCNNEKILNITLIIFGRGLLLLDFMAPEAAEPQETSYVSEGETRQKQDEVVKKTNTQGRKRVKQNHHFHKRLTPEGFNSIVRAAGAFTSWTIFTTTVALVL